jgi:hypothetical protein
MEDERVDRLLRTLRDATPAAARPGFTERVLARLDAPRSGVSANWLPRLTLPAVALAATFVVAASLLFTNGQLPRPQAAAAKAAQAMAVTPAPAVHAFPASAPAPTSETLRAVHRRALAQIRSEQARLTSDLRSLRRAGNQPFLYVGGDEQVDLIVNLDRVRDRPSRRARTTANPGVDPGALSNQTF